MRRLLREPLLHFFVLGALLFGLYAFVQRGASSKPTEIIVTRGQLTNLRAQFEKVWQRAPTQQELDGLVENWVREEVFYREGLAMGLDRDDPVVRRRIGQKMEFIVDSAIPVAPTDAQLQEWLDQHPEKYSQGPTYSLRQVFFDPGKHGDRIDSVIATARHALESGGQALGDATMLPAELIAAETSDVERTFGGAFAAELANLPIGAWQGPVRSGFGLHLVVVSERTAPRKPALDEVRTAVERDLLHERTQAANDAVYQRLRNLYSVRVETAG
jgi:hypothetical protein